MTSGETAPPILFFGNDWAAENRTSSHHIARWLARGHRVYYIECPGMRAPKGSPRDLKKIWAKVSRFFRGPRVIQEGLQVWTLLQLPLHRFRLVRLLNQLLLLLALRWLLRSERISNPLAWYMLPHLAPVVGRLGERLSVYYCTDDFSAMPNVNALAVRELDAETARRADLVFVTSETLLEGKRRLNPNTYVSPHGVDLEHFGRAWRLSGTVPAELAGLPRPIIGFHGLIERWIDLGLVEYLARHRPGWTFILIGRVAVPRDEVPHLPNIHYLGVRSYDLLPEYGRHFDAAIIPYRLNRQVHHANPLKLREYLAMGKPIVSVATPEVNKYADVVRVAHAPEEFLSHLDAAVAEGRPPEQVRRRVARVLPESWDSRLRAVLDIVQEQLERSSKRPGIVPLDPSQRQVTSGPESAAGCSSARSRVRDC